MTERSVRENLEEVMEILDENKEKLSTNDYLKMCNLLMSVYNKRQEVVARPVKEIMVYKTRVKLEYELIRTELLVENPLEFVGRKTKEQKRQIVEQTERMRMNVLVEIRDYPQSQGRTDLICLLADIELEKGYKYSLNRYAKPCIKFSLRKSEFQPYASLFVVLS